MGTLEKLKESREELIRLQKLLQDKHEKIQELTKMAQVVAQRIVETQARKQAFEEILKEENDGKGQTKETE